MAPHESFQTEPGFWATVLGFVGALVTAGVRVAMKLRGETRSRLHKLREDIDVAVRKVAVMETEVDGLVMLRDVQFSHINENLVDLRRAQEKFEARAEERWAEFREQLSRLEARR